MQPPAALAIDAILDGAERPVLACVQQQLAECLESASGRRWSVACRWRTSAAAVDAPGRPAIVIVSLLPEAMRDGELIETEERWRTALRGLAAQGARVVIANVFRHVAARTSADACAAGRRLERIRRLNRMAADLSCEFGANVADIDRTCAHFGARALKTDYRLGGRVAAEMAAHAVVSSILALGFDESIAPEIQERAQEFHGQLNAMMGFLKRRLQLSPEHANAHGSR